MKRLLAVLVFLGFVSSAKAVEPVLGDLFPYENRHSSATFDLDTNGLERLSIQLVYSTPTVADVSFYGATDVDTAANTITKSHTFATGMKVLLATAAATAPEPLTTGTTYFVVKISDSLLQLATTYAQAATGDEIDILGTSATAMTLRPLALSLSNAGILWYGSNDGANWDAVNANGLTVNQSTQALTSMGIYDGARLLDWSTYPYRFLRLTFNGPASGVMKLRAFLNGIRKE